MRTLALVMLVACGAVSPEPVQGPRAIRTTEHVDDARKHDEIARSRTSWPATADAAVPAKAFVAAWDPDAEHAQMVELHRGEAAANEKQFEAACGRHEIAKPIGSPLTRHRVGGWTTEDGAVVLLGAVAGPHHRLLADLRCYRARLMAGAGVEKDSPLALPGLLVEVRGTQDGITLTMTMTDTALVPELQRRMRRQLEELQRLPRHED